METSACCSRFFGFLFLSCAAWAQSFQPGVLYPTQNGPIALASGDFNGDGKLDLAVANGASSSVSIYLGKGDGTFTAGEIVAVPGNCLIGSLTAGDFNGDQKVDLLAACSFQSTLWVLPGLGTGQFGSGVSTTLPLVILMGFAEGNFEGVSVADFNGDGKLDVAVDLANTDLMDINISIMLGNGDGTFQAPVAVVTTGSATNVVAADMNGDGKPDLVVAVSQYVGATEEPSLLLVMLGDGKGGFTQRASYTLASEALLGFTTVADVNRDGIPDVLLGGINPASIGAGIAASNLAVYTGNGDGTLTQSFAATESDLIFGLLAADFRGTGTPDLIETSGTGSVDSSSITISLTARAGNGDGTFESPLTIPLSAGLTPFWFGMVAGDWNGNGLPDLAFLSEPVLMDLASLSGSGFDAVIAGYDALPAGNLVVMLNTATPPPSMISMQTNPSGLQFTVDGGAAQTAPKTLSLAQGPHTIAVLATQPGAAGTQYVFTSWSDSVATASRSITVGSSPATYTANFQTQYQLTISASPAAGGTVTPASGGFFASGTAASITATAASGYQFASWTGPVANASAASTSVTMSAPETVVANFSAIVSGHPAFFSGEDFLGSNIYYLQFTDGNLFGYYGYLSSSILYHLDMGYEAFIASTGSSIYFYDFASGHWWYSSASLFPYIYDFTLNTFIYYIPDTKSPGHYTTNPRYFSNLATQQIFTM